ncbi:MAG: 4-hydroxybenzoate octaprenyltransferase [Rickettsiales bacterium]|nr:4-hydroxybenzoate octaprenyltransferase [Rickettsiales bacterium]
MWPCWWSIAMASDGIPNPTLLLLFFAGAVLMRSAGCAVNDLIDRDIDKQVERTKTRPLAAGTLSPYQAITFITLLIGLSAWLLLPMHPNVLFWAAASLLLVAAYPFMKRITWWPQAFLGLTFNAGAIIGWVAIHGEPALGAWLLYAAGFFWTLGYDTIYAHQDITDDLAIGVKSTAILFGKSTILAAGLFYFLTITLIAVAGFILQYSEVFFVSLVAPMAHFIWQIHRLDIEKPHICLEIFRSNKWLGGMVFLSIILEKAL